MRIACCLFTAVMVVVVVNHISIDLSQGQTSKRSIKAEMDGSVSGKGFAAVRSHLIKSAQGMCISYRETGSGSYQSHYILDSSKTWLGTTRELSASQEITAWNLTGGRTILINSSWTSSQDSKNARIRAFLGESYLLCRHLNHSINVRTYSSRSLWTSSGDFEGLGFQEMRWMNNSIKKGLLGNFTIQTKWFLQEKKKKVTAEELDLPKELL